MKKDIKSLRVKHKALNPSNELMGVIYHIPSVILIKIAHSLLGGGPHGRTEIKKGRGEWKWDTTLEAEGTKKYAAFSHKLFDLAKIYHTTREAINALDSAIKLCNEFVAFIKDFERKLKRKAVGLEIMSSIVQGLVSLKGKIAKTSNEQWYKAPPKPTPTRGYDLGGGPYPHDPQTHTVVDIYEHHNPEKPVDFIQRDLRKKWNLPQRSSIIVSKVLRALERGVKKPRNIRIYKEFAEKLDATLLPGGTIDLFDSPCFLNPIIEYFKQQGNRFTITGYRGGYGGDIETEEDQTWIKKRK